MRRLRDRMCRLATVAFAFVAVFAARSPTPAAPAAHPVPSAAIAHPAPTPPPNRRVTYTYKTFYDPATVEEGQVQKFNVAFGTMTLTFNPDKSIHGKYAADLGYPMTVTGGVTGGGTLRLQTAGRRFTGQFTPRGFALFSAPDATGRRWRLWGQFERQQS